MSISANYPSIRPTLLLDFANTEQLDPRISFSRPTTGTYYDGKTVALAEQNVLYPSNTLNGGFFVNRRTTTTINATVAPDGTTTASLLAEDTNTNSHGIDGNLSLVIGNTYTRSVFVKKGSGATAPDIIQLAVGVGGLTGGGYVNFNISTGVITASTTNVTGSIVSFGSGWYRCAITFTATASVGAFNDAFLYFTNNNPTAGLFGGSYAGAITADVFVWGAQAENRSTATAYTPTTTAAITNYVPVLLTAPVNEARFQHNPTTGESLGLLIEQQSTNIQIYSEDFSATTSLNQNITVTNNVNISPAGTLTAALIVENTATAEHRSLHYLTQSYTAGASFTASVYVKRASGTRNVILRIDPGTATFGSTGTNYNLTALTVDPTAGQSGTITAVGNGWYRLTITATASVSASGLYGVGVWLSNGTTPSSNSYLGDGVSGIYIWGVQLEAASFATSYIPTVVSQVTRSADVANMTGTNFSSWYRTDQGTLYTELVETINTSTIPSNSGGVSINANSTVPCLEITVRSVDFSLAARGVNAGGVSSIALPTVLAVRPAGTASKIAMTYTVDTFGSITSGAVNGLGATNATKTANAMTGINQLDIGKTVISAALIGTRTFRKISYYPVSVTLANLQALTGS